MRVMTWNLWWRFGPWQQRRCAISAVLHELRPDLVGLQEVWADGGANLARDLAEKLGMHCVWAPSRAPGRWQRRIDQGGLDIGNAILSRWPITEQAVLQLPAPPQQEDDGRLALYAQIAAPTHAVPMFTTQLSSMLDASALRCRQVRALAAFVATHQSGTAFPPVLTGDLNAWPDSDEVRLLGGYKTAPAVPGQVFFDAREYAALGQTAATWDRANPHVAAGHEPSARIDYIHLGPPGPGGLGHVTAVRRAGDRPVDGTWPSDHTAVLADLTHPACPAPA
ncbi:endonuclease [Mangrovactinospora gilvigrisea]|uniref:Endonuclease n=1 Tax=Mangrovactinospora gilvigrisea TaxID=1428644 RepID=A0A1J7BKV4_9ACTN|nr:endonuclease/exonuclease/phosphatase family protein [Mangrovactinospora gilvigrisea]OIV39323.1 endonuclease [Mangrovactinospora gilvigrisea]